MMGEEVGSTFEYNTGISKTTQGHNNPPPSPEQPLKKPRLNRAKNYALKKRL